MSTFAGVAARRTNQSVPTTRRVVAVRSPACGSPTSLHLPAAWRIRLSGAGAAAYSPSQLEATLLNLGLITDTGTWRAASYYQLENPLERYIQFASSENINFAHGVERTVYFSTSQPEAAGTLRIENPMINEHRCTLSFVPPTATETWLKYILEAAGIKPTGLMRNKTRKDQWHFDSNTPLDIVPHYLHVTSGGMTFEVLLQVAGRLIECRTCGLVSHRSNKCPAMKEQKRQDYQARQNRRKEEEEKQQRHEASQNSIKAKVNTKNENETIDTANKNETIDFDKLIELTEEDRKKRMAEEKQKEKKEQEEKEKIEKEEKEKKEERVKFIKEAQRIAKEEKQRKQKKAVESIAIEKLRTDEVSGSRSAIKRLREWSPDQTTDAKRSPLDKKEEENNNYRAKNQHQRRPKPTNTKNKNKPGRTKKQPHRN